MGVKIEPLDGLRDLAARSPTTTRPPIGIRDLIAAVGQRRRGRLRVPCATSWLKGTCPISGPVWTSARHITTPWRSTRRAKGCCPAGSEGAGSCAPASALAMTSGGMAPPPHSDLGARPRDRHSGRPVEAPPDIREAARLACGPGAGARVRGRTPELRCRSVGGEDVDAGESGADDRLVGVSGDGSVAFAWRSSAASEAAVEAKCDLM